LTRSAISAAQRFAFSASRGPAPKKYQEQAGRTSAMVSIPSERNSQLWKSKRMIGPSVGTKT
jgi:hypothetical protein